MTPSSQQNPAGAPQKGHLYLIPSPLGSHAENRVLPQYVMEIAHSLETFFVERIPRANAFLRWIKHPVPDYKCRFYELNKHTTGKDLVEMLSVLKQGTRAGILSEAGCPSVADPGSNIVRLAHESGIPVTPLVGPSSILLALMASGLNGQSFAFHGYLPKTNSQRIEQIRRLQNNSFATNATQIFMETPYRNNELLGKLIQELRDDTLLCTASNLTLDSEQIITRPVSKWKETSIDLNHQPSLFLLQAGSNHGKDTLQKSIKPRRRH